MSKAWFLTVLVGAVSLVTAGIALADHSSADGPAVAPSFVYGKVSNACVGGQKLDGSADGGATGDIDSGTYPLTFDGFAGSVTITVSQGSGGPQFTFVTDNASHVLSSVYVKGGPYGANLYEYAGGIAHDDGLHSGWWKNSSTTKWYGLSHLCFFTDKK